MAKSHMNMNINMKMEVITPNLNFNTKMDMERDTDADIETVADTHTQTCHGLCPGLGLFWCDGHMSVFKSICEFCHSHFKGLLSTPFSTYTAD
jgi:hypothetical protein